MGGYCIGGNDVDGYTRCGCCLGDVGGGGYVYCIGLYDVCGGC